MTDIGWYVPADPPINTRRRKPLAGPPALSLTPDTLPPHIAGMAWFEPPPRAFRGRMAFMDTSPAFDPSPYRPIVCRVSVASIMRNTAVATVGAMSNLPLGVNGDLC